MTITIVLLLSFFSIFPPMEMHCCWKELDCQPEIVKAFCPSPILNSLCSIMQTSCCVMDVIQLSPGTNNSRGEREVST
jgi:hypothetical protein